VILVVPWQRTAPRGWRAAVDERVGVVASAGSGHPCRARHDRLETMAGRL